MYNRSSVKSIPNAGVTYGLIDAWKAFQQVVKDIGIQNANPFTAGGFITSTLLRQSAGDVDLFFHSEADFDLAYNVAKDKELIESETRRAVKLNGLHKAHGYKVDLVRYEFGSPELILNGFDINACCIAVEFDGTIHELPEALDDISYKRLRINKFSGTEATGAIMRIAKYANKGLTLDRESAAKMAKALSMYTYPVEFETMNPIAPFTGRDFMNEFWDHEFNKAEGRGGGGY